MIRPLALAASAWLVLSACATTTTRPRGIYFVMVDRFENGDRSNDSIVTPDDPSAFHGGDLQGLIDRLDWIQSLGFDTVWLSPVFAMRTEAWHGHGAFHGYWTWDLSKLEPRFGTEETLRRLRAELDRRHMKLLLDLVLNHVGPDAPLLTQHPDWFHHHGGITDWNDPVQLTDYDVHGLPDLATEKPEVFAFLLNATRHWLDVARPDGFRLDAVKHLPVSFWARFRDELPNQWLLGELLDGDPQALVTTWKEGRFSTLFDFPLGFAITDVFCRGADPSKLAAALTNDRRYPDANALVTLVDNHDLPRLASACGGDRQKIAAALRFLLAMRGTPSIIWGTEIAATGEKEPDNRASMRFVDDPLREVISGAMAQRAASRALREGTTIVEKVGQGELSLLRVVDGEAQRITVRAGQVEVGPASTIAIPKAATRRVTFSGQGQVVGSGPELGDWKRERAMTLPVTLELPVGGVFELKRIIDGQWEEGPNRVLWVRPDTEMMAW
ncbi:MAG: alpha-amylase family glycosyl hydrolase [Myxococcaceae bacterium]